MVTLTMEIDEKVREKLEKIAEDNYRSLSAQIRLILDQFLEKGNK